MMLVFMHWPHVEVSAFHFLKEYLMGAKKDINEIYFSGCLFIAVMIGLSTGSGAAFVVAFLVLICTSMATSKIR